MKKNPRKSLKHILLLSFFLPFVIVGVCFALHGVSPFGSYSLLRSDAWAQYHPFLAQFRHILKEGGSLEHSWSVGMGIHFLPIVSYYLSSPLYLLSVFVPELYLTQFMTLMTMVKLGLAGCAFAYYLWTLYRRIDTSIPFFGLLYALCAWSAGYYWNIIWLDVFALLPLLTAGSVIMLRDGRYKLYVLSLALCFWCNYYLSFCCCLFILLCFFGYHLCHLTSFKNLLRSFIRFGLCTVLALCLAGVLLLPTLMGMQNTSSVGAADFPLLSLSLPEYSPNFKLIPFLQALGQTCARTLPNVKPTYLEGLPNLYCGFSILLLAVYYLCCKHVGRKERLFNACLLVLFVLSCIFRVLDYVWHGFRFPNMLPNRFTFLFSFVLLGMAYRGWYFLDHIRLPGLLIPGGVGLGLMGIGFLFSKKLSYGYFSIALTAAIVIATLLVFVLRSGRPIPRLSAKHRYRAACTLLCLVLLGEGALSFYNGTRKGVSQETTDAHLAAGQALCASIEKEDPELFYRIEESHGGTSNDGALLHCNGSSIFSSSALVNFGRFASALGMKAWPESNSNLYIESTPLTTTLCGIKYLISEDKLHLSPSVYPLAATCEDYLLLSNPSYIGMGFMAKEALGDFVAYGSNKDPFGEQTELFNLAVGAETALYHPVFDPALSASEECTLETTENNTQFLYTVPEHLDKGEFTLRYTIEEAGLFCISTRMQRSKDMVAYKNGEELFSCSVAERGILSLGDVVPGDVIELRYTSYGYKQAGISIHAAMFDTAAFEAALPRLSDETWKIHYADDTTLKGSIEVKEDGLFFTSIPYEPGWKAYVDGQEVSLAESYDPSSEDVKLTDAVISFPLSAGKHEITLQFRSPGLRTGLILSLCALAIFLILLLCKKKTILPDLPEIVKETPHEN